MNSNTNKISQSLLDILIKNIPELNRLKNNHEGDLYSLWKNEKVKISNNKFKKPVDFTQDNVIDLERRGLIECIGDEIIITSKGKDKIKKMILEDSSDFALASNNANNIKTASKNTRNWYKRIIK